MDPRLVDLSHTVSDGLVTYPGLPAVVIDAYLSRAESRAKYSDGTTFHIGRIQMVGNAGTYLDAPFHRFEGAPDIAHLALERLANLPAVVVDAVPGERCVGVGSIPDRDLLGHAVLIRTGASDHFATPRYVEAHPYLSVAAAEMLVTRGVALVGIDSLNIDDTATGSRPVHTTLLQAGVLIVEHLNALAALPREEFRFFAVPVKVAQMGSFPVRAFAIIG